MNHRSIPSLSSSISSNETNQSPRTSSSSYYNQTYEHHQLPLELKKSTETNAPKSPTSIKRWDDSQLEMELAEDDLISNRKVRRNSSLRIKQKLQFSESYLKSKFASSTTAKDDKDLITEYNRKVGVQGNKFSRSMKKIYHWILS